MTVLRYYHNGLIETASPGRLAHQPLRHGTSVGEMTTKSLFGFDCGAAPSSVRGDRQSPVRMAHDGDIWNLARETFILPYREAGGGYPSHFRGIGRDGEILWTRQITEDSGVQQYFDYWGVNQCSADLFGNIYRRGAKSGTTEIVKWSWSGEKVWAIPHMWSDSSLGGDFYSNCIYVVPDGSRLFVGGRLQFALYDYQAWVVELDPDTGDTIGAWEVLPDFYDASDGGILLVQQVIYNGTDLIISVAASYGHRGGIAKHTLNGVLIPGSADYNSLQWWTPYYDRWAYPRQIALAPSLGYIYTVLGRGTDYGALDESVVFKLWCVDDTTGAVVWSKRIREIYADGDWGYWADTYHVMNELVADSQGNLWVSMRYTNFEDADGDEITRELKLVLVAPDGTITDRRILELPYPYRYHNLTAGLTFDDYWVGSMARASGAIHSDGHQRVTLMRSASLGEPIQEVWSVSPFPAGEEAKAGSMIAYPVPVLE